MRSRIVKALAVMAFAAAPVSNAATFTYTGMLTECSGICAVLTFVGAEVQLQFDYDPVFAGDVMDNIGNTSNVSGTVETQTQPIELTGEQISAINLTTDANGVTGGSFQLTADPLVADPIVLDVTVGLPWGLLGIATGEGAFEPTALDAGTGPGPGPGPGPVVPIPAAAWLFGSALLGLVGIRRRATA